MNETIHELREREKKEITYLFCGLGSFFIWALMVYITIMVFRANENTVSGIILLIIPVFIFATYCFIKADAYSYKNAYPMIPRLPRVQKPNKKKEVSRKDREKIFNNNYEIYKTAFDNINQIKERNK